MPNLVLATHEAVAEVSPDQAISMLDQVIDNGLVAFVVKQAGKDLKGALNATRLPKHFQDRGFSGTIKQTVDFTYKAHNRLPENFQDLPRPVGDGWYYVGITPFHADQAPSLPGTKISVNHTRAGSADLILHKALIDTQEWDSTGQWDALDKATGDMLWDNLVDPTLMDPVGAVAHAEPGDLWVFDASYLHIGRSIVTPRSSETMFFDL